MFGGTQSENTKKLYTHNLTKLNNGIVPTDTKFLKKSKTMNDVRNGFLKYLNLPILYEFALENEIA
jgi:hypothetical protein